MRPPRWFPLEYAELARAALDESAVRRLLVQRSAIVLERIARGGGATNWYVLASLDDLETLATFVAPGSKVSFYFDRRISEVRLDAAARRDLVEIARRDNGSFVGVRMATIELDRDFPAGQQDFDDWFQDMGYPEFGFVGAYPGPDNDGVDAVTLVLPDLDGEVRLHPY